MLRISKRVEYALLALRHLAQQPGVVSAREIAQAYNLSAELLGKVLQSLARTGLLYVQHGVQGGYALLQHPKMITLRAVVEAVEPGWRGLVDCSAPDELCYVYERCTIRQPLALLERRLQELLDSMTIAELLEVPSSEAMQQ